MSLGHKDSANHLCKHNSPLAKITTKKILPGNRSIKSRLTLLLTVSKLFGFKNRLFTIPTLNDSDLINDFISFRFPKKPAFLANILKSPVVSK